MVGATFCRKHGLSSNLFSLGQLIKIINEAQLDFTVDQLITFLGGKEDELRDIAGLGTQICQIHNLKQS
jgi:hypothetical protein